MRSLSSRTVTSVFVNFMNKILILDHTSLGHFNEQSNLATRTLAKLTSLTQHKIWIYIYFMAIFQWTESISSERHPKMTSSGSGRHAIAFAMNLNYEWLLINEQWSCFPRKWFQLKSKSVDECHQDALQLEAPEAARPLPAPTKIKISLKIFLRLDNESHFMRICDLNI